jgi:uncharacterized protein Yka (UPF0111/DUF47 family)
MKFFNRFLPHNPDVLALLSAQAEVTIGGLGAFVEWASGERGADMNVRMMEKEADLRKEALRKGLVEAFVTPIGGEDIYFMSSRLDAVLNGAKDTVREAEVLDVTPDPATLDMAKALAQGVGELAEAFAAFQGPKRDRAQKATAHARAAHVAVRTLEPMYRDAMRSLLANPDLREAASRREMYRRLIRMSEDVIEVADRVWYTAVKES